MADERDRSGPGSTANPNGDPDDPTDRSGDGTDPVGRRDDDRPHDGSGGGSDADDAAGGHSEDPSQVDPERAPLDELATSVEERRGRSRDAPDDQLFTEEDVQEIDTDAVWESLDGDESAEPATDARDTRVVEKDAYCEGCPYFSPPPEVSCGHDGTEILELVDMDRFRVVDCPKVRETERLEQL